MPAKNLKGSTNPLKITDTTFRDGHQCTVATRFLTEDLEPIAAAMDDAGFHSVEMWGGATFDVMTRFLGEDPWERVRILKRLMPKTPFQMLLRGQNLVGYRNYADDLVRAFVAHSAEVGIDIFRIFDALNDPWNLETSVKAVRENGKHAQAAISYSVTEGRLGGEIYNLDYFVEKALQYQDLGADSICIKDMAGLINPNDTEALVTALKSKLSVPLQLHTHYTSGMASMAVLKAAEAGIDAVDACLAPLALRAAQPAVEPIIVTLQETERDTGLDLPYLLKIGEHLERVVPRYRDYLDDTKFAAIDTNVLMHQIPGGMISNLVSQLREAEALDRLNEVYEELPRTRADMGYPPLVTPTSQIVGVQAANNVLFGRYEMITSQVKDYCYGLYGRPPRPIDPELVDRALKDYPRGREPITTRTGDVLEPELEKAREETKEIAKDIGDVDALPALEVRARTETRRREHQDHRGHRARGRADQASEERRAARRRDGCPAEGTAHADLQRVRRRRALPGGRRPRGRGGLRPPFHEWAASRSRRRNQGAAEGQGSQARGPGGGGRDRNRSAPARPPVALPCGGGRHRHRRRPGRRPRSDEDGELDPLPRGRRREAPRCDAGRQGRQRSGPRRRRLRLPGESRSFRPDSAFGIISRAAKAD